MGSEEYFLQTGQLQWGEEHGGLRHGKESRFKPQSMNLDRICLPDC